MGSPKPPTRSGMCTRMGPRESLITADRLPPNPQQNPTLICVQVMNEDI